MPEENITTFLVNTEDNYLLALIIEQTVVSEFDNIKWYQTRVLDITPINLN